MCLLNLLQFIKLIHNYYTNIGWCCVQYTLFLYDQIVYCTRQSQVQITLLGYRKLHIVQTLPSYIHKTFIVTDKPL